MKDLLVYVADLDAEVTIGALLRRPARLGLRHLTFDIKRHPMRDSGMVKDGPELARMLKGRYHRVVLLWDHHGSGWEQHHQPPAAAARLQERLDTCTWRDASAAIVLVPELEAWVWHDSSTVGRHLGLAPEDLAARVRDYAARHHATPEQVMRTAPKELLAAVLGRRVRPEDFARLAELAAPEAWAVCDSFRAFRDALRSWFAA